MEAASTRFPVRTRAFQISVEDVPTEFLLNGYSNRILVVATQTGTFGTVLQAKAEPSFDGETTFSVSTLMGKRDEEELTICARRIIESAAQQGCNKPFTICLGAKRLTLKGVKSIVDAVLENRVW
ncbi:hypothetical protein BSKO_11800 [Bryopsis sp. KO-2023]|nr:hypothetical protein BSKO_11800 [Bryopsis sp. KO-2023]